MNFEGLEQFRYENTKAVMEAMKKIACDEKAEMSDRLKAAKLVDAMSDSIIKAYLLSDVNKINESHGNKLIKQMDRLTDKED